MRQTVPSTWSAIRVRIQIRCTRFESSVILEYVAAQRAEYTRPNGRIVMYVSMVMLSMWRISQPFAGPASHTNHPQPHTQQQRQQQAGVRLRGRKSDEAQPSSAAGPRGRASDDTHVPSGSASPSTHQHPGHAPGHSSFSSGLPRPVELPPLPLKLPPKHLYTCTVGRNRSQAR